MKSANEIREEFLKYFEEEHNSKRVKSSSLIPDNPTILLTTAGMVQFIPYFLGLEIPPYSPHRATSCQKCARAGGKDSDIENVGRTPRHHTFFEMLGNFSFGDYFKEEIIPWSWKFITENLNLDKSRLWITIYESDDEAYELWQKAGVPKERILRKGKKDNFWGPVGTSGSCGPCSEIHYDLGENLKCSDDCSIATCECDRWIEIWNLVFTELFQDEKGNFTPLKKKNVDTGMGLERISMVVQNVKSTFETDLLKPILDKVCEITNKKYGENEKTDVSLRIITDHARCVTFMINDMIYPSNEGRGYVLRMILRRALRHGKILGLELPFLYNLVDTVILNYKGAYPDLEENKEKIKKTIIQEEERFKQTLDKGQALIDDLIKNSNKTISGAEAFKLYDTFGYPFELTQEIALENGLIVDKEGFDSCMAEQKQRAKSAVQKINLSEDLIYVDIGKKTGETEFLGYEILEADSKILALIIDGEEKIEAQEGDQVDIILDKTPFYAQSGGQQGDCGSLKNDSLLIKVEDTFKVNKVFVHRALVEKGILKVGDMLKSIVDKKKRSQIEAHHSAAHLLQAALRVVLGDKVKQAGSQVSIDRTRYDFSYDQALSKEEVEKVENLINSWINEGIEQNTALMKIEEAKKTGAMALFGEKYENDVRVVSFGEISKELCGGTHCKNTKDIRLFKIVSEGAISAGSRRIEAVVSDAAFDLLNFKAKTLDEISQKYKTPISEIDSRIEKLHKENKDLSSKVAMLETAAAKNRFESFISRAQEIKGGKLFITKTEDIPPQAIKAGIEMLSSKLGESIIILVSIKADGIFIISKVSDSFVKIGANAGQLVSKIASQTGGKGGGRPNFAQGAGKDSKDIDQILSVIEKEIKENY